MKRYVTFGQSHIHEINNQVIDKDCVVIMEGTKEDVFKLFGEKFSFEYSEETWNEDTIKYFPRGYINI